ncbi:GNAT family N-acetyltransferase [Paraglaciecola arctica]|uniref:GCN5-related N-acetyltransferase n=1 Tax=Paraglaciecola arctica BSs20135 TaxID=493475 RepID=K6YRK2_9ALTE|nr:GNAT family N-acetyltransferase [Paraglaciecola arctica]GAC19283.1 GCN5-related N-acetyltransferase [Paraglaciecola arctica BSs20135]
MKNYTLVQATKADFDILLKLRLMTMATHLENAGLFLSEEQHKARVYEGYAHCFLIHCNHQIVGMLKYKELPNSIYIMQLQIFPAFQNKGVGRSVVTQLIQNKQGKNIELTVLKDNPAKNLYERLGFIITGEDEHEYFMQRLIN